MTDRGGKSFKDKHGLDTEMDEAIKNAVLEAAKDEELPCALAFKIAEDLGVPPGTVGVTLDLLNFRLTKCQMGLFGYKPNKKIISPLVDIPPDLKEGISSSQLDQRLPCKVAWDLAASCKVSKMTVSNACETLGIKIKPCQLGAF
jgi:hypothetical protein